MLPWLDLHQPKAHLPLVMLETSLIAYLHFDYGELFITPLVVLLTVLIQLAGV